MWFASLSNYRQTPGWLNFCIRLLQGSPEVLAMLEHNPFPAPRLATCVRWCNDYHFTDLATHRKTGDWWRRDQSREYLPVISLQETQTQPPLQTRKAVVEAGAVATNSRCRI